MSKRKTLLLSSLSPSERKWYDWCMSLPPENRDKLARLMQVLERATKRGDEFTERRFCKVPVHLGIDHMLTEMERTPAR